VLILDEADRMLDMGFIRPVEEIAALTPKTRQTLLFSATLKGSVLKLAKNLLNQPVEIRVDQERAKHENIEQRLHMVDSLKHKQRLLEHLLSNLDKSQAIVFTSTKRHADQLSSELKARGYSAAAMHGDMDQRARVRTLSSLRDGHLQILVATDVAARGIDVENIGHVINFNLPMSGEDYVHRIGRTGRAGKMGVALSFAAPGEISALRQIEKFTGQKITPHTILGLEPKGRILGPRKR
jgi:superfamily II DNA/RNA helicase